jgi:hypothetical protein
MTYALSIIEYPSGRFGFVGSVPCVLAYSAGDAEILDIIARHGPGLARRIAKASGVAMPESLSWATRSEASEFAASHGCTVA